nr:MAG: hypothetical protein DIU70_00660 [Bacillota bacterium]
MGVRARRAPHRHHRPRDRAAHGQPAPPGGCPALLRRPFGGRERGGVCRALDLRPELPGGPGGGGGKGSPPAAGRGAGPAPPGDGGAGPGDRSEP